MKQLATFPPRNHNRTHLPTAPAQGQTIVEVALVLPLLLLVLLAVIEFGRMLTIYSLTSSAAREATRYGTAVDTNGSGIKYYLDCAGMRQAAKASAGALMALPDSAIVVQYDDGANIIGNCGAVADQDLHDGDRIRVTINTAFQTIVPLITFPPLPIQYISTRTLIKEITSFSECNDGLDNDVDGLIDYPADPNCSNTEDNTEAAPPGTPLCWPLELTINPSKPTPVGTATVTSVGVPGVCPTGFGLGYLDGTEVTIHAEGDAVQGYYFSHWSGTNDDTQATTTVTMNALKQATAYFVQCFDLNVTVNDDALGTVTIDPPGGNCPDSSGRYYGNVTLTAEPIGSAVFSSWSGTAGSSSNPELTVTMNVNHAITATFTNECYDIGPVVANPGAGGTATLVTAPNCNGTQYASGTMVTVSASSALGYVFTGWTGGFVGSGNPSTFEVTDDVLPITAHFTQQCYTLTTSAIPDSTWGSVTASAPQPGCGGGQYPAGQVITVTANSVLGPFFGWSGDLTGSANPASLLMNGNKSVTANFVGQMHVASIAMVKLHPNGNNWYAQATVTVVDSNGTPLSGVTVTGVWTNDGNSWANNPANPDRITNSFGQVTFNSDTDSCKSNNTCTYVYRVTNLVKAGYVYVPAADQGNPASIVAP